MKSAPHPSVDGRQGLLSLTFDLNQGGVQTLCSQAMQEESITSLQGRQWNERMFVVHQANVGGIADQPRRIQGDRLIQLQRVASAPKITIGQEQLIQRSVDFDC